ncbi:multiple cyclophane-containing RiPP AmcA [Streptomyces syringium]|uniref:multiple cyclophane-containing RiPP AmcA n=1 Tax=Streptomyces syringium TaxID=76729 RepID=UPI0033D432E9
MPTPTATDRVHASADCLQALIALVPCGPESKFDNRATWDNTTPKFDNRPTWDNWNKRAK